MEKLPESLVSATSRSEWSVRDHARSVGTGTAQLAHTHGIPRVDGAPARRKTATQRLREEIRERLGAAYSAYAYNTPSRAYDGYGVLKVVIPTDPGRVEEVIQEVKRIAASLATEGVTEDELRRVVDPMVAGIKDMRRDNRYWLNSVLTGSARYPQQLDWSRNVVEDYASISKEEVFDMARTYLGNDTAASVIIKPDRDAKVGALEKARNG